MTLSRLGPCLVLLILSPLLFSSSGRDDSYITYWPAHVLATEGGIHNYNAERIEQSSSLLHVIVIAAAAHLLPLPIPSIGPLLSLAFGGIAVLLTYRLGCVLYAPVAFPAAMMAALSSSLLYWSVGGMEATLAAVATLWFLLVSYRYLQTSGASHAVVVGSTLAFLSVRPESFLVLGCTYALLAALCWLRPANEVTAADRNDTVPQRALGTFLVINVVSLATLIGFRLLYFHSAFPQPVLAKAGRPSLDGIISGLGYLGSNALLRPTAFLWAVCGVAVVRTLWHASAASPWKSFDVLLSCFVVAYVGVIVAAGGDWMEGGRFLVPVLPVLIVLALTAVWRSGSARVALAATLVLAALQAFDTALLFRSPQNFGGPLWKTIRRHGDNRFSWFERANALHAGFTDLTLALEHVIADVRVRKHGAVVSVLTGQIGMVPYHISLRHQGEVRWIDRFGLADRDVTVCRVTRDLPRSAKGLMMPYDQFFQRRAAIRAACDFADPDVIFDRATDPDFEALLQRDGYVVVFREQKRWVQWIAVRSDLATGALSRRQAGQTASQ